MSLVGAFIVPHPPLILPNVGKGRESSISKTIESYQEIASMIAELEPDTIIISSPHAPLGMDCFLMSEGDTCFGDFSNFGDYVDSFSFKYDVDLVEDIISTAISYDVPIQSTDGSILDHGTMVPLYFIRQKYTDFKIVRIGLSNLSFPLHYQMGQAIQKSISHDKKVVYIASGDLSHKLQEDGPYGFSPEGPLYDQMIIDSCSKGDFLPLLDCDIDFCDKAAECGHRSILMMCGALDGYSLSSKFYSHEDVTGVGYGVFSYIPLANDSNRFFLEKLNSSLKKPISDIHKSVDPYVLLAYRTLDEYYYNDRTLNDFKGLDEELLMNRAGVFVTIFQFGQLRGCIGTFLPTCSSIAEEIVQNAIQAATHDFRFSPITEDELDTLEIHVDVLSTPEDISSIHELDPIKYGVIVTSGSKRGLLLPDLEGVDSVSKQIQIAKDKAGILGNEDYSLQRFEVTRHF